MSDNAKCPDLKILIAREELSRFMNQLNVISPIPLSLIDNNGVVIYENGSIKESTEEKIDPADSGCCFPIEVKDIQIGAVVGEVRENASMESVKHIAEMLSDRLAYELKVDNLASEIVSNYQELNLIYEMSGCLSSVLDIDAICEAFLNQAVEIIGSESAFVMLIDSERKRMFMCTAVGFSEDLKGLRIKIENSIYESVIQNRTPLVIDDIGKYPHLRDKMSNARILTATPLMCVPVIVKGEVSGVISMSRENRPFTSEETKLLYAIASQAGMSLGNARLYGELHEMFLNTVEALAAAVEAKDPYTYGHSRRVAEYSVAIGGEIGLPGKEIADLRLAGILHDIGKIGMSESILKKPGPLTEDELEEIKNHSVKGAKIIEHIEQMNNIALWIRHHHERYDGTGYPDGLKGEGIPLHSRILAVAETYDAMTSSWDQDAKYPYDIALMELKTGSGSQFDPEIVDVFVNLAREDAYEQYLEAYQSNKHQPTPRLTRFAYYRIDNEITNIMARQAMGRELSESEQTRIRDLRGLLLRTS